MVPINLALDWFHINSENLISFLSKEAITGDEKKNVKDRLLIKLQSAERFIQSHKEPFFKEVTYLIYWSCFNEIIHQNFFINRSDKISIYFKLKISPENVIVKESKSKYYTIKAKPKNEIAKKYEYILRLKEEEHTFIKQDSLTHPSFLIRVYLNLISYPNYREQYIFSYLANKRNKLSLIHDDEKAIATRQFNDTVNIYDCIKIFKAVFYLLSNDKTTEIEDISKNKNLKNIKDIKLGKILSISNDSIKIKNKSNIISEYPINDKLWESYSVDDYVELDFEKENDRNIDKVKDIIFLF